MGYSSAQAKAFIAEIAPHAQDAYKELGKVLPSVCIGMAILESAAGTSSIMRKHNAFFGQKVGTGKTATKYWNKTFFTTKTSEEYTIGVHTVIKAAFRSYVDARQCVFNYYELLNSSLYRKVKAGTDYRTQMAQIKECGYMTSSTEVNSVISIIGKYDLTKYDSVNNKVVTDAPQEDYTVGNNYKLDVDLFVRSSAAGTKLKYDALTIDAKKNARYDVYGCAILKKGTTVTCQEVKKLETSTWIRIPSGWVCGKNSKSTYIV